MKLHAMQQSKRPSLQFNPVKLQNNKSMCTSSAGGMSSPSFWSSMASGMPSILVAMTGRSKAMASQMHRGRTSFKEGWSTTSAAR